jgi:hypothetical protein
LFICLKLSDESIKYQASEPFDTIVMEQVLMPFDPCFSAAASFGVVAPESAKNLVVDPGSNALLTGSHSDGIKTIWCTRTVQWKMTNNRTVDD